jgi:hypothetical protein
MPSLKRELRAFQGSDTDVRPSTLKAALCIYHLLLGTLGILAYSDSTPNAVNGGTKYTAAYNLALNLASIRINYVTQGPFDTDLWALSM